nr:MAG: late control gene D protein [Bacteriophage sp.]
MKFIDVTALADASVTTDDNQGIGSIELFAEQTEQKSYGTFELNQFVLDGSKSVLTENPKDIAFWNDALSKEDCTFETDPKITVTFQEQHTSAAITLYFEDEPTAELKITWYTIAGTKLITETFYPDSLIYVCNNQVQNYGKIEIEFVRTSFPQRYIKLQYILYGKYIIWDKDMIQTAKMLEDIDVTSATLSINEADISIVDMNNDFDAENENGAWKSVQKTQEVTLSEFNNGNMIPMGAFFIDDFSFSKNIAKFKLIDVVGLLDKYTFYDGQVYNNVRAEVILNAIFVTAGIKKYVIDEEVGNILLSGYLAIQTCRKALQQVCFACGAVADDSRSDTIKVYKPDRYVKSTVGTDRKFNGNTKVSLEKYISGVNIEMKNYALEEKTSDIYKKTLPAGDTKITFSSPYLPSSITASAGTLKEVKTNYLIINMPDAGQCHITGIKYANTTFSYEKRVDKIEAGETENIKKYSGCTIYNADILPDIAAYLLYYHALRKKVGMKYLVDLEQVGNWANINSIGGKTSTTLIESQTLDLTGGFIATATCRGYSIVVTEDVFAGTELYTGGDVLI